MIGHASLTVENWLPRFVAIGIEAWERIQHPRQQLLLLLSEGATLQRDVL